MRKLTLLLLLLLSVALKATNYTSVVNGNWSSSSTWNPTGVPGSTDTVTIANTVTLDSNKSVFTITINSGKTLTVSGSNVLTVYGNFINNGTFTANTGIVYFNGTGTQTLGGSTATTFYIFAQYGSGTVTLGNNITVSNNFILEAGTFDVSTSNYSLTLNGPYVYFFNTFNPRSGTVTFSGSGTTFIENSSSGSVVYNNVVVNATAYASYGTQVIPTLTINSGKYMHVYDAYLGNVTNNGTFYSGYITLFYSTGTVVSGSGVFNLGTGLYQFYGTPFTIGAGITFNCGVGLLVSALTHGIVMTNLGTITGGVATNGGTSTKPCKLTNGSTGSITTTGGTNLLNSFDTVDCSTPGNTLIYNNTSNTTLRSFLNNKLGNLTINPSSGTTVSLANNLTVGGNLTLTTGTLDATTSNYNLTVGGNFTNNATFTPRNGTVTFNGSNNQTISGTGTISFYNFTQNQASSTDSLVLANVFTVNNNLIQTQGVLNCKSYQITGNGTGSFSMASGTVLLLGSPASSTNVAFPSSFTGAHCSLNANSNVIYRANSSSQNISTIPTYGNLIIGKGTASPSSTLVIGGNLTTSSGTTLSISTSTVNLTGNATNNGTLSFSGGTLNIGGNFNNNGTFTAGTGTVVFNGSGTQNISSIHSSETFENLTINSGSNVTSNCHLNIQDSNITQSGATLVIQ